jgi:hypothetical protein
MCFKIRAVPGSTTAAGKNVGTRRAILVMQKHLPYTASAASAA